MSKIQDEILKAHNYYRQRDVSYKVHGKKQAPSVMKWDKTLQDSADEWAEHLINTCGQTSIMDRGPAQNVTKVTGSTSALPYSWTQVVDNWLYEGCDGFPHSTRGKEHFMTAAFKTQGAVGCSARFIEKCEATGKSLQVYVCDYEKPAPELTAESKHLYPSNPSSAQMCSFPAPFSATIV